MHRLDFHWHVLQHTTKACAHWKTWTYVDVWDAIPNQRVGLYSRNLGLYMRNLGLYMRNLGLYMRNLGLYVRNLGLYP